ncbi:MAG: SDR family NAD(P)-dependent oxidoreductase [Chitinophagaceae bacterium]
MSNDNSIVLITGVSREEGIGYGLAKEMVARNFRVIIAARDLDKAKKLAERLASEQASVSAEQVDITSESSVEHLSSSVEEKFGKLDILINNAGGHLDYMTGPLESDFQVVKDALDTNLFGTWRMIKHMHALLKKSKHPRIVNISSGAGSFSHPIFGMAVHPALLTAYGLSKLALNGLTVQLARQLKNDHIIINAVNPGFVATAEGMEALGARSVSDSIQGIVWAATLPDDGPSGKFFEDGQEISW